MNTNEKTREELKAILDEWIPKYIRQVVELRSGSRLSAERYNELMNLLITQGDDTIELAETVKQYVEILVDELSNDFVDTTESLTQALNDTTARVTAIADNAVDTAESAVSSVNQYKAVMDTNMEQFKNTVNSTVSQMSNDIVQFKESVTQAVTASDAKADSAVATANKLTADMETYRTELIQLTEQTFTDMQTALSQQVSADVSIGVASLKDELIEDINATVSALEEQVMTIANTAEQVVNSAVQDIENYKQSMDVRLDAALKEVEDSLSVAGEVIQDAAAIYAKIDEIDSIVKTYEDRLKAVEENTEAGNADTLDGKHADDFAEANHTHTLEALGAAASSHTHGVTDISGTLSVDKGGTGKTTAKESANVLVSALEVGDTAPTETANFVVQGEGSYSGQYYLKPLSMLWSFIKSKADSVYAKLTHTHTKSQITDFPTSMTPTAHTHDDRYYTETETNNLLAGKQANLGFTPVQQGGGTGQGTNKIYIGWSGSRLKAMVDQTDMGNFVFDSHLTWGNITGKPTSLPASDVYSWAKQSAKPSYSWSEITSKPTSFTPTSHTHTKSQITDFPTSLPASDVYSWAKASSKPKYTASEVGAASVESGTFSLLLTGNTVLSTNSCGYHKVGNLVFVRCTGSCAVSVPANTALTGLPFSSDNMQTALFWATNSTTPSAINKKEKYEVWVSGTTVKFTEKLDANQPVVFVGIYLTK